MLAEGLAITLFSDCSVITISIMIGFTNCVGIEVLFLASLPPNTGPQSCPRAPGAHWLPSRGPLDPRAELQRTYRGATEG